MDMGAVIALALLAIWWIFAFGLIMIGVITWRKLGKARWVLVAVSVICLLWVFNRPSSEELERQQAEMYYQTQLSCRANSITQAQYVACVQLLNRN
jgi:hypothetical protein